MHQSLFYKGERGFVNQQHMRIGKYTTIDFCTYLNGCSYGKWMQYTILQEIELHLDVAGDFIITLVGYHLEEDNPVRIEFLKRDYHYKTRSTLQLPFPTNDETIVGFEITSLEECCIYGGTYIGRHAGTIERETILSIVTTTFCKENYITENMHQFQEELLESSDDRFRNNIYIHVVDNGRTLNPTVWNNEHLCIHTNKNVGGSGGFARGMLETLHQKRAVTHVLLMDDDVFALPESVKRTYALLSLLKPSYEKHFISGAMLDYDKMQMQCEDIGVLTMQNGFTPLKPKFDHDMLVDNLRNEGDYFEHPRQHAAWWYCCIPISQIQDNGLPLPLFIRCDDMEYSRRCHAKFITMNGICIWHKGFASKYNAVYDLYYQFRNWLIAGATSQIYDNQEIFIWWKNAYKKEILRFHYNGARLLLEAMQDYLRGPQWIEQEHCEEVLRKKLEKNEKLMPLVQLGEFEMNLQNLYQDLPRKFLDKCFYHITLNGHRFYPTFLLKKGRTVIPYNWVIVSQKQSLRQELIAVNPVTMTGVIRRMDKKRFQRLQRSYKQTVKQYKKNHVYIEREYVRHASYMVSEKFWRKYLDL